MKAVKVIGFDFDNTLILSEKDKRDIVSEIFERKYKVKRGVKTAYSKMLGKLNREEKLKRLLKQFVGRDATRKEIKELSYSFSKGYEYKLATCPLVHCEGIIKKMRKKAKFMFLLSLEEKEDVEKVAKHCGVAKYFDEILGGPKSKMANFKHILKKHKVDPEETIYVGDSKGDVLAAKKLGVRVIAVNSTGSHRKELRRLGADFVLPDLCELSLKKV